MAALAAAAGVGMMLAVHVVTYAYQRGRTDHRLDALERGQDQTGATDRLLSALTATVDALKDSVDRLDQAVVEINRQIFRTREP